MRTRASIMQKQKIDYDYEATRPMCEGCNKLHGGGRVMTGYICTMYNYVVPSMYLRANECPRNPRKRTGKVEKVHVGQGKTRAGGNR